MTAPSGVDDADMLLVASTEVRKDGSFGGGGLADEVTGPEDREFGGDAVLLESEGRSGERGTVSGELIARGCVPGVGRVGEIGYVDQRCIDMSS